jgi:6-phosphogluconolactonase
VARELRIVPLASLGAQAAQACAEHLRAAAGAAGRATVALSGGQTPRRLYEALAAHHAADVPWARVHLFWGDERYVPHNDPLSNYRLARESLLARIPIPDANVHAVPTGAADPAEAAGAYEALLRRYFPGVWPRFDLILLGMGPDGHTASLFPGTPVLQEDRRWVREVRAPVAPPVRLTLTLPVLNRAAVVFFLVTGADKAETLRRVWTDASDPPAYPAAAVRPQEGRVVWWVDPPAAARLPP